MNLISKLLRKNISPARLAGFLVSNLIGLTIVGAGLQFYLDARSIWAGRESFLTADYISVNKIIDASHTLGAESPEFTEEDIADLRRQPWVEKVGAYTRADFNVHAQMALGSGGAADRRMTTAMFFEAVPDEFLDIDPSAFSWQEGQTDVPIAISKDYLALYNFGFAGAAGLPRLSETLISGVPLRLTLSPDSGSVHPIVAQGHIAGYSNRFNTILVPRNFLDAMNARLGRHEAEEAPSRLIINVNSPGDAAIKEYLDAKGWEMAGDKTSATAAYMLRVVSGIIMTIGVIITLLSAFILVLSISLLMEKNRRQLHSLLMLGYQPKVISRPYRKITASFSIGAGILAFGAVAALRAVYMPPLRAIGAEGPGIWPALVLIAVLTGLIVLLNFRSIHSRILSAWR